MSLVKAYLKGVTDPIALAKEYYDDMLYKSIEAAESVIAQELSFDMDKDMKEWSKEIKEAQDEIKFWDDFYNNVNDSNALRILFDQPVQTVRSKDEVESIAYSEIPEYIKELEGHIKNIQANIQDADEEYKALVEKVTGASDEGSFTFEDYKDGKRNWPDYIFYQIHKIGLDYIQSKIDSYTNRFEALKESGEMPQVEPKKLTQVKSKIKQQLKTWEKMYEEGKRKPSYLDRQEKLKDIRTSFGIDSSEWRWSYYESKISMWELRKKNSLKQLKQYDDMLDSFEEDADESDEVETKPQEKEQRDRKDIPDKFKGNMFYSDETWWKQLSAEAKQVTESDSISSRKEFQTALSNYFENAPSPFDTAVISGNKTKTGIGEIQVEDGEPKYVKETPATRLANLKKLYTIFESLPENEQSKSDVSVIMDGLKAEIDHWDLIDRSKTEGKLTFAEEGKRILKLLNTELDIVFSSIRGYKDEDESKPRRLIRSLNKIKETGLKLNELKIFATGKVTIGSLVDSEDKEIRERAQRLLKTFDSSSSTFTKVVEKLNKVISSQEDTVISRLEKHWYDDDIKSVSGKTKEESQALNRQMDRLLGKFERALDVVEGAETNLKDEFLEQRIESALEQLQESLENITNAIETEGMEFEGTTIDDDDDALDWFIDTYEVWQDEVAFVLQQLNPSNKDYIRIMALKKKIIDELKKLPQLHGLIDFDLKKRKTTTSSILQDRRNLAEHLQNLIAMSKVKGSEQSKQKWLKDEESIKQHIEGRLSRATTPNGKKARDRLINKILKNIEFKPSDFNWDTKQAVSRQNYLKELDEEYDESDVGHRETEELIEGGEESWDTRSEDAFEQAEREAAPEDDINPEQTPDHEFDYDEESEEEDENIDW